MKNIKIKIFILLIFICFSTIAQNKKNDWQILNLKGKVKSIENFTYFKTTFDNEKQLIKHLNYTCKYDKKGHKIKQSFYSSNGNVDYTFTWKYNTKGQKTQKKMGKRYIIYTYDKPKGNLIEETI